MNHCTLSPDKIKKFIGGQWLTYDYSFCCALHDERYETHEISRKEADEELRG